MCADCVNSMPVCSETPHNSANEYVLSSFMPNLLCGYSDIPATHSVCVRRRVNVQSEAASQ